MCGIFGMAGEVGSAALADQVIASLKHRGPDDQGVAWFDDGWMAHTRLAIIDLSPHGRQPMSNTQGTTWVTFNGEIYNYVELREELRGYPFKTQTDTEVILAAYDRWGLECLSRLRGMFAFGLWDRQRRLLVCATDRFSIKPLYYHIEGARLTFASEIKPLALCGVRLRPNEARLYEYLATGVLDHSDETLFDGIRQLRPGTMLVFQQGTASIRTYWDLGRLGASSDAESERGCPLDERIETMLNESVRLHLRGDVEVGLSLSSGLDSHLLKALVRRQRPADPLECFTFSFPDTPYDEWRRSEPGRQPGDGCRYHAVALRPEPDFFEQLQELIRVMEEPIGGLGIFAYWRNAKLAADCGINVLLDGQGADELFGGYRYYYESHIEQLWRRGDRDGARSEFRRFRRAHAEETGDVEAWLARRTSRPVVMAPDGTSLASSYLRQDFEARFRARATDFPSPFPCAVKNAMYQDLVFLKIPKLLRFQDRCAMAWGVEVRVPYLDHPLAECLFHLPADQLFSGGLTKGLLRRIGQRYLPAPLLEIPKLYVAVPQREWLKTSFREPIERIIQESRLAEDGYIVAETLLRQFREYAQTPALGNSFFIWKFINLELWYRTFCASDVGSPSYVG